MSNAITDRQKKQYRRLVEDTAERALIEAGLDKDKIQRVIEHGNELLIGFSKLIREISVSKIFANEETISRFGYFSGYSSPKPIAEQIKIIHELFPGIKWGYFHKDESEIVVPLLKAEGHFAIPRWNKIASTYNEAVQIVLNLISQTRNGEFCNYRKNQFGPEYLRQSEKSIKTWEKIGSDQKDYDILIIPAHFGIRHRGRSVRRALEMMNQNEFGLGAYEIGIMLLTHPERLKHCDDLHINCAGDEFSPDGNGITTRAPYFEFVTDNTIFGTLLLNDFSERYGCPSGFIP